MNWLVNVLLGPIVDKIVGPLFKVWLKSKDVDLEKFRTAVGGDVAVAEAHLQAWTRIQEVKRDANMWWGAKVIILMAGGSCALHVTAIMLDSTFSFGWGIPRAPAPYDVLSQEIVKSFFILGPAIAGMNLFSRWLQRK